MNNTATSRPGALTEAKKPSPVQTALGIQSKVISELHSVIGHLEDRLRTVREVRPTTPGGQAGDAPDPIQVNGCIEARTRSIEAASGRLHELIAELVV